MNNNKKDLKAEFTLYDLVLSAFGILLLIGGILLILDWYYRGYAVDHLIDSAFKGRNPLKGLPSDTLSSVILGFVVTLLPFIAGYLTYWWGNHYFPNHSIVVKYFLALVAFSGTLVLGGLISNNYSDNKADRYAERVNVYVTHQPGYQFRGVIYQVNALKAKGNRSQYFGDNRVAGGYLGNKKNNFYYAPTASKKGKGVPNLYGINYMPMQADGTVKGKTGASRYLVAEIKPADKNHAVDTFIVHKDRYGNLLNSTVYLQKAVYQNANRVRKGQEQVHKRGFGSY